MTGARLELSRLQILAFRRKTGALDQRLPPGADSLRRAAWASLPDSMPRAALFSIHARVEGTRPTTWEDPSLVQLWGPRFSVCVVSASDLPVFSLGTWPDDAKGQRKALDLARRLDEMLAGRRMSYDRAGDALGINPQMLKYAAAAGTVLIRWDGAHASTVWTVPAPEMDPGVARLELARRYVHIYGPTTPEAFARWAGIGLRSATRAFAGLGFALTAVRTPLGDAWILSADEVLCRAAPGSVAAVRLLPSGDPYLFLHGPDRELLVPNPDHQRALWPTRVWPGGVLCQGEIVGTWRRSAARLTVQPWRTLTPTELDAVAAEAQSLPLAEVGGKISVRWQRPG